MLRLQEVLDSTPPSIANSVNAVGLADVTPAEVQSVARTLCDAQFDPTVTTSWLDERVPTHSVLLLSPATRLLRLADRSCAVRPTSAQEDDYGDAVYDFVAQRADVVPANPVSPTVADPICSFLDSQAGGAVTEAAVDEVIALASRNRIETEDFLPILMEVVGGTCDAWLPIVEEQIRAR